MSVVALLLAFAVGAGATLAMSVFGFMAVLTTIFAVGSVVTVLASSDIGFELGMAVALFVSAQLGYALGLLVLSRLEHGSNTVRRDGQATSERRHLRFRK